MSLTLAQRKALAARTGPDPAVRTDLGRFDPVSCQSMQTVHALLRTGARLVHVERGRVLLRRGSATCVVDATGRVDWREAA
jgi:hypothetical protein